MNDFIVALGLMAALEGLLYAAAPGAMKRGLRSLLDAPDSTLRYGGLAAMALGVLVVWAVRG